MSFDRKSFLKVMGTGIGVTFLDSPLNVLAKAQVLLKPAKLQKGDTIGMISPASNLHADESYSEVMDHIEKLGFKTKIGKHAKDHFGYLAGTDENRAADLNQMFADPSIDAIWPFRGGWGSNRILEYIDYEMIEKNPKPLIGYSDITSLLLAIHAKTGLITYHGPVGKSPFTPYTLSYFKKALMQAQPFAIKNMEHAEITTITEGTATGTLLGGNLSVLTAMLGSEYVPNWQNALLFIEDVGEDIYRIDRMLTQLRLNKVFEKINGLIFGNCTDCEVDNGYHFTLEQIVEDHIKEYEIPAFVGANFGHIDNMFTVPVGIGARMDARQGTITLLESPVKSDT